MPPKVQESHFRRFVTVRAEDGRSGIFIQSGGLNLGTLHEFWATDAGKDPLSPEPEDATRRPFQISPGRGGSVFRFVDIPPESDSAHLSDDERRAAVRYAFSRVNSEDALVDTSRHPGMHQTETIDYIILLRGQLTMLLDEGEIDLNPFDVVVQRGTNHAWVNKGDTPALLAAVLIAPA